MLIGCNWVYGFIIGFVFLELFVFVVEVNICLVVYIILVGCEYEKELVECIV